MELDNIGVQVIAFVVWGAVFRPAALTDHGKRVGAPNFLWMLEKIRLGGLGNGGYWVVSLGDRLFDSTRPGRVGRAGRPLP